MVMPRLGHWGLIGAVAGTLLGGAAIAQPQPQPAPVIPARPPLNLQLKPNATLGFARELRDSRRVIQDSYLTPVGVTPAGRLSQTGAKDPRL